MSHASSSSQSALRLETQQAGSARHDESATLAPELLAPAGSWDCAKAAVENGADAIYFGLDRFNARMRAHNFTTEDLPELMAFLHSRGVRGYITLNTLVFPKELKAAAHYLRTVMSAGVDAAIVQDVGICRLIRHLSPDFPIHASTQMTVTSAAGVKFAKQLGCSLVVLARECSLKAINKIQKQLREEEIALPLETFVHGALCVAYSGQCLTSESLGGRSANRGECAQACRMTYDLISDGKVVDLGGREYLLSPQDLSGLPVVPDLIAAGVRSLKIEGRLKTPEYVANVTRVYRKALDQAITSRLPKPHTDITFRKPDASYNPSEEERYSLEMAFSRGLSTGWFQGINNQQLVHARFGKKRGAFIGKISRIQREKRETKLVVKSQVPTIKTGDGVLIDSGSPDRDQGGRLYRVEQRGQETFVSFGRHDVEMSQVKVGYSLWKTSDPELDKELRQTYSGEQPKFKRPVVIKVQGKAGEKLVVTMCADARAPLESFTVHASSQMPLVEANSQPLTTEKLTQQLGRLGTTPFKLAELHNQLHGDVMVPVSALNQVRRDLVKQLMEVRSQPKPWTINPHASHRDLLPSLDAATPTAAVAHLIPLVRKMPQIQAALSAGIHTLYCELEDPRRYQEAMQEVAAFNEATGQSVRLFVAPPRITKMGERYILEQVRKSNADGYLVRNYDHLEFFAGSSCIGDFSLNVANPITAAYYKQAFGLERLCASYDLNVQQLQALLESTPPHWLEITIHQHMPMFHMEHCVFCAFLSKGTDFTNCGRPCEKREVRLRDRTQTEHILQADAGCRNTVFNGRAQTGAEFITRLTDKGARHFRIEFLNESPAQVQHTLSAYQQLFAGDMSGSELWQTLNLSSQLGVTRGTLEKNHR
ncbi:MAG: DUF3656 domain-containing protein [Cyanobacteria bacterium P01_D01_bin.105]